MAAEGVFHGVAPVSSGSGDFNMFAFIARSVLSRTATTTLVQIVAVENAGGVEPVGFVDVHPMIAQLDGVGNATPHGVIHNVPYARIQGGANAIIIDPVVGDIGIAVFAGQDISVVKNTREEGNPGSRRRFSMADAIYIGGVLNGTPEQFVRFHADGIEIKAPTVAITGDMTVSGALTVEGQATAEEFTADGIALSTHRHGGVDTGAGTSGGPVP